MTSGYDNPVDFSLTQNSHIFVYISDDNDDYDNDDDDDDDNNHFS
jgi:hypothetical protein